MHVPFNVPLYALFCFMNLLTFPYGGAVYNSIEFICNFNKPYLQKSRRKYVVQLQHREKFVK